jgi:hypothetical protein
MGLSRFNLNQDLFLELRAYYAFVYATEETAGEWHSWVAFDRKVDHAAGKTQIASMRHLLKDTFASEHEAVQAGAAFAQLAEDAGTVGL